MPQKDISIAGMFVEESIDLLNASMVKIEHCVGQLSDKQVWWRPESSINSIGNLILHLAGNLRQWGIAGVRQGKDDRDRDSEFVQRGIISSGKIMSSLRETVDEAKETFGSLNADSILSERTIQGFETTVMGAISHTCSHFVGHAHQIILLTRLQLGDDYQFHWAPDADQSKIPI